ncbi:MAG: phospholipase D family protein [Acidimicrobiia bacterium]
MPTIPDSPTSDPQDDDALRRWFLSSADRGNPATAIDLSGSWTTGNRATTLVDGEEYFARLRRVLSRAGAPDLILVTDWEGHRDQRLGPCGPRIDDALVAALRAGAELRMLLWRSHPRQAHLAEQDNAAFARELNHVGGDVLLDERVRRGGSHHQKLVIVQRSSERGDSVAFVGGIDICHGRADGHDHCGDPQTVELDRRYGRRPPWHDIQLEVRGPAVSVLSATFAERWNDPTPLDHRLPWRALARRLVHQRSGPHAPLPPAPIPPDRGRHAIQVLRTYPVKRPPYPFAPRGERSVARAYLKAFANAQRLVYIEDQYLWSGSAVRSLARARRRAPELLVVAVLPRFPDRDGRITGAGSRGARLECLRILRAAAPERVAVFDLENEQGRPIYVHAKVCVVDDLWMAIGSDNLNRRSWTHDSEVSCAVIDAERDMREPIDPAGRGEGARVLARETRLRLAREHLGGAVSDAELLDPKHAFRTFVRSAAALDDWYRRGRIGPRPDGRLRAHRPEPVAPAMVPLARVVQAVLADPDGRPRQLTEDCY